MAGTRADDLIPFAPLAELADRWDSAAEKLDRRSVRAEVLECCAAELRLAMGWEPS